MRTLSLKAGLAATFISLSSIAAFASDAAPPVNVEEPRVGIVLDQLQSAVDGIKIEHQDHNLSAAQTAKLDNVAMAIRRDAEHVAAANKGRIPKGDYHQLLARIEKLGTDSGATTSVISQDEHKS